MRFWPGKMAAFSPANNNSCLSLSICGSVVSAFVRLLSCVTILYLYYLYAIHGSKAGPALDCYIILSSSTSLITSFFQEIVTQCGVTPPENGCHA